MVQAARWHTATSKLLYAYAGTLKIKDLTMSFDTQLPRRDNERTGVVVQFRPRVAPRHSSVPSAKSSPSKPLVAWEHWAIGGIMLSSFVIAMVALLRAAS
jgi:hypothetical protein